MMILPDVARLQSQCDQWLYVKTPEFRKMSVGKSLKSSHGEIKFMHSNKIGGGGGQMFNCINCVK